MSLVWEMENLIILMIIAISKCTIVMTADALEIPNRNFEMKECFVNTMYEHVTI